MNDFSLRRLITELLSGHDNPSVDNVTKGKPIGANAIRMILRSPVAIHAQDGSGRHTGPVNADPASKLISFEEQIPNSSIERFGGETYLTLDTSQEYQISLEGLALGSFTLTLEEYTGDDALVLRRDYVDIPVSGLTKGGFAIQHVGSSSFLRLDTDGDGTADLTVAPNNQADTRTSLDILRKILPTLGLPRGLQTSLIAKLDTALAALDRKNMKAARNAMEALQQEVRAQLGKQLTTTTADGLLGVTNKLLVNVP